MFFLGPVLSGKGRPQGGLFDVEAKPTAKHEDPGQGQARKTLIEPLSLCEHDPLLFFIHFVFVCSWPAGPP